MCSHVFENTRPIVYACTSDGEWQFLCSQRSHADEVPYVVGLSHLVERDESLKEILDLPIDWEAVRDSIDASWERSEVEED